MQIIKLLKESRWSPYLVGTCLGVLSWFLFAIVGETFGSSRTFVRLAILLESWIVPKHAAGLTYFKEILGGNPIIDWQFAFIIGLLCGAFVAAYLAKSFNTTPVPKIWERRFGPSLRKRYLGAFFGGILLLFGARLAGGCTSGHGLAGGMMLAVSGWVFVLSVFLTGIPFAYFFYRFTPGQRR